MPLHIPVAPLLQISALNNCLTVDFPHPYHFRGEFHPFWEMIYATEDRFRVSGNEMVYTMRKGDVIFHRPMEFHRLWSLEGQNVHAYIIGFCANEELEDLLGGGAFTLNAVQQAQLESLMAQVQQLFPRESHNGIQNHLLAMQDQWTQRAAQIQMFVDGFQLFLLSLVQESSPLSVKAHSKSQDAQLYRSIVRMLSDHLQDWVTAEQIAQALCYSPSRIKRTFAKYSDIGIHKYLLKLKTAEAIRLLRQGESCSEVSRKLGFSNQNYFSTVFKRETGLPPSNYTEIENGSVK